jgi:hypothetical protein
VTSSAFSLSCRAPGPLGLKHFVDLSLDIDQLRRFLRVPCAISECIEHVQRLPAVAGFTRPQEFPGCSQYRDKPSEDHRRQKDRVAPFVEETLLGAIVAAAPG